MVRVLYRSTGLHDEPIPVSGAVIIPPGPMPPEGRPIVAWAHPTTGVVPRCAPSMAMFLIQQIQGVREMVQRGYIVAATDYPGLGTPETHPYLVGESEARAVLELGACGAGADRSAGAFCRVGTFARRAGRIVHRHAGKELRAGA